MSGRTHEVEIYRPQTETSGDRGRQTQTMPAQPEVREVRADVQPRTGEVRQTSSGQIVERDGRAFLERRDLAGCLPAAEDGLLVTDGPGQERWKVLTVSDRGRGWDVVLDLELDTRDYG